MVKAVIRFILIFCVAFAALAIAKGWQLVTDGFRLDKIAEELPMSNSLIDPAIKAFLSPSYHYLSKGCQVYVFESDDCTHVLKFIRFHKYKTPFWLEFLIAHPLLKEYRDKRIAHRVKARSETMRSYRIAGNLLQQETGILYAHLNKTAAHLGSVVIVDRLGRKNTVNLDETGFVLQKKMTPLEFLLQKAAQGNDASFFRSVFTKFLKNYRTMCKKGVVIKDYNCVKNSGMLDGSVVGMDLGSFFFEKGLEDQVAFEAEARHFSKHFYKWIAKNHPVFLPIYEEEIQKCVQNYEKED